MPSGFYEDGEVFSTRAGLCFAVLPALVAAQTADELQQQIDSNNAQIQQLDNEIANYQAQLDSTTKQKTR